jgi:hypothetical protein
VSISEAAASNGQASSPPAVEVRAISKDFGSNQALYRVDLRIGHGEVVGSSAGAQQYIQQIIYGAALVAAVSIPKVARRRIFKRAPVG